MFQMEDPITIGEAAKIHGISPQLFDMYLRKGLAPKATKIARYKFFERKDIMAWQKPTLQRGWKRGQSRKTNAD